MTLRLLISGLFIVWVAACSPPSEAPDGDSEAATTLGFAGLGASADEFAAVDPGDRVQFPEDHGAHPGFRIEWWYVTANLVDASGLQYGVQWTLFRQALKPSDDVQADDDWHNGQVWMAHAALTTPDNHWHSERFARSGGGQAGVSLDTGFEAWLDNQSLTSTDNDTGINRLRLVGGGDEFGYELNLNADRPPVLHGRNGYSQKSEQGQASWYISQPFYGVTGHLRVPDREDPVDVTGQAWLDHEWSSQPLSPGQAGWDWFSLHLDSGHKAMLFRLRDTTGSGDFLSGTWIAPDGQTTPLSPEQIELTPTDRSAVAGRDIPTEWRIRVPLVDVDVTAQALNPQSWNEGTVSYWEGPIEVHGSHSGVGYLEMTGY